MRRKVGNKQILDQRIIVVGTPGSGKTSLIAALSGSFSEYPPRSRGINISKIPFEVDNLEINVSVWDFVGQEIYGNLYNAFTTPNTIHILVLDSRNHSDEEAERWLENIQISTGGGAPCVVVLNKSDLGSLELNRRDLLTRFPFVVGFSSVSQQFSKGIDELRYLLLTELRKQEVKVELSDSFEEFKEILRRIKRYVPYGFFNQLAIENGLMNNEFIKTALEFFHESGFIFFHHSRELKEAVVIEIDWLIENLSAFFNDLTLLNSYGRSNKEEVFKVFEKKGNEREETLVILSILKQSSICFESSDGQLIVPGLLPTQMTDRANYLLNQQDHIRMFFAYRQFPRLVFEHMLSLIQARGFEEIWSNGILINNIDGSAILQNSTSRRRIELSVPGHDTSSKKLFQNIRTMVHQVLQHFSIADIEELVPAPDNPDILFSYDELVSFNERNTTFITKFINKKAVDINIKDLLKNMFGEDEHEYVRLFISYVKADAFYKEELIRHLSPLIHEGLLQIPEIMIGDAWEDQLMRQLNSAHLILVLLSPDLLASSYFYEHELPAIVRLHETGRARVIPVLVRDTYWQSLPISKIAMLPFDGQPIANYEKRDSVWRSITAEIRRHAGELTGKLEEIQTLKVSRLTLRNIRCFDKVEVDFLNESGLQMISLLLGENGVGKSTILRSIPLGIANESETIALLAKMSGDLLKTGKDSGTIVVTLFDVASDREYSIETNINKDVSGQLQITKVVAPGLDLKKIFICGYGAARNRFGTDNAEIYGITSTCASLYNYDAFLQNPELSFRRIQSRGIPIDSLLRRVDQLLILEPGSTTMDNTGLRLKGPWGEFVPIGGLGDGYKAMLGWISDLLGWSLMFNENMFQTAISGIVIVDELEQHLHPRWQLIIIKLLKDIFPKVQFIVSSHTPLLASGAADYPDAGIYTIERGLDRGVNVKKLPREMIEGENINKVLSEAFGMLTSLSPKSIQNIERFAYLSSQPSLNSNDAAEYERINTQLSAKETPPQGTELDDETLRNKLSKLK